MENKSIHFLHGQGLKFLLIIINKLLVHYWSTITDVFDIGFGVESAFLFGKRANRRKGGYVSSRLMIGSNKSVKLDCRELNRCVKMKHLIHIHPFTFDRLTSPPSVADLLLFNGKWHFILDMTDRLCGFPVLWCYIIFEFVGDWLSDGWKSLSHGEILKKFYEGVKMGKLKGDLKCFYLDWEYYWDNKDEVLIRITGIKNEILPSD